MMHHWWRLGLGWGQAGASSNVFGWATGSWCVGWDRTRLLWLLGGRVTNFLPLSRASDFSTARVDRCGSAHGQDSQLAQNVSHTRDQPPHAAAAHLSLGPEELLG